MFIEPTTFIDVLVAVAVDTSQLYYLIVVVVAVVVVEEVAVMLVVLVTVLVPVLALVAVAHRKLWCEGSGREMLAVELVVAKVVLPWWPSK